VWTHIFELDGDIFDEFYVFEGNRSVSMGREANGYQTMEFTILLLMACKTVSVPCIIEDSRYVLIFLQQEFTNA